MTPVLQVDAHEFERPEFQQSLNQFARVYLAEGDSWLSYGSTKFRNVVGSLQLPVPACVLNISQPGDTLRRMHETTRNPQFFFYLRNKSGRRWNGIFLSGGGNDLIDAIWNERTQRSEILLQPPVPPDIELANLRSVINEAALADLLSYIKINASQIVTQGRDQIGGDSNGVPLFMHTSPWYSRAIHPSSSSEEAPGCIPPAFGSVSSQSCGLNSPACFWRSWRPASSRSSFRIFMSLTHCT